MKNKNVPAVFCIAVSVLIVNAILVLTNYNSIPDQIIGHIDIAGNTSYNSKIQLIYGLPINLVILIIILFFILKPKFANYPVSVNPDNQEAVFKKMQYFLSVIAIFTSLVFAFFTFKAIDITTTFPYFVLLIVVLPGLCILYFTKKLKASSS
jgi:hypothetical protein